MRTLPLLLAGLLLCGQAAAHGLWTEQRRGNHEVSATTDAQGYAEVVVRNEGLNIIAAELYLPLKGNPDIEELGLFSSLTFLGQAHHE